MDKRPKKRWFQLLFGLVFATLGVYVAYVSAGKMAIGYLTSTNWVEVPATLHSIKLERKSGEIITYYVTGNYSYRFNGSRYSNNRISLSSGRSDNIGTYWQGLERRLQKDRRSNEASAFVNPNNPSQSVLDRTFRWGKILFGSLFLLLFGGFGTVTILSSIYELPINNFRSNRKQKEKQKNGIKSHEKWEGWLLLVFGSLFFSVGMAHTIASLPKALEREEYAGLLILLFVFIGAGVMIYGIISILSYRKFGPTLLFLNPEAPGVGGQLGAQFDIKLKNMNYNASSNAELWLSLIHI